MGYGCFALVHDTMFKPTQISRFQDPSTCAHDEDTLTIILMPCACITSRLYLLCTSHGLLGLVSCASLARGMQSIIRIAYGTVQSLHY